ncbi:alpha/beta hydrolase family protein [Arcticibacter tournemirensis]|uniref:Xylan esterase n=2 Tax=Pseudomonadati TaxID=3379134 RepID=A0A4Q0MAT5_9SPHI|nr:acetylxylan esterase [Arcticibacter tournemirensis]RXF70113.1 xylan esterase [Arcticibacter tournemirensis]
MNLPDTNTKKQLGIRKLSNSVRAACITLVISFAGCPGARAQKEFDGIRGTHTWMMFSDAPNALYHHLAGQAFHFLKKRAADISALQTLPAWQQRQKWIQSTLTNLVGPFPQKTPLQATVTKIIHKEGYRVENLVYQSQPGFYVTASLFIPSTQKNAPKPAIIYCSGHSENGYRTPSYQHTILNLVQKGFVVFAFDPIGQGERLQYYNQVTGKSRYQYPAYEHSYAGAQLFISGSSLARYMTWDGIRAIDYLITRKEVDPGRIGITGRSGGGTQSAFVAAFDSRIKAVASENYFTSFTRLYQSMGPQDAEQDLFHGIKAGIDMADFLSVRAPKPALMITTTRDMFPVQGAIETAKEVSALYEAYGSGDHFRRVEDDAPHAATRKNREAMYAFFQKFLDEPGDSTDRELAPLKPGELQVTKTGQLATSLKSETVFSLNNKAAKKQMDKLHAVRKDKPGYFPDIIASAKALSGYQEPQGTDEPVFTGRIQRKGYTIEKYFVKGEGTYVIPYLLMKPENPGPRAIIYLNPRGKSHDANEGGDMEWLVNNGFTVLAPDIIGCGEAGPGVYKGDSYIDSVSYNIWFASILTGQSIAGIQAGDVVRLEHLLRSNTAIREVYGLAKNEMGPVLLHAAAFDKNILRVALIQPYSSYRSIVISPDYKPAFLHSTVPGVIGKYDLPDLAGSLAPRKLLLFGVTNAGGISADGTEEDRQVISDAYKLNDVRQLQVIPAGTPAKLRELLKDWIADE